MFEKHSISNFIKIRPVRAELFHAHGHPAGRTNMTYLIAAFPNFANAPKNYSYVPNKVVHWVTLLGCIQEVTSLNPGRVTDCNKKTLRRFTELFKENTGFSA
jgi:hypothetical protein